jgi:cobalamin transport system substrate-binding protein
MALVTLLGCGKPPPSVPDAASGPRRIVSLVPSVTETLFALGAGPEVVGVSQYGNYPKAALKLPRVGTFLTPNIEEIAALRPTLVIGLATSSDLREIHALRAMGYTILLVGDDSIEEIKDSIQQVGGAIGRSAAARHLLNAINLHMRLVTERLRGVPSRRVLMLVGHQPLVAVGHDTFLDQLLTLAHADNIADAAGQSWPQLSLEYVVASRPQVILDGQMGSDPATPGRFWSRYRTIPAVRSHRVFGYPQDPTLQPGPRIAQSLELLARLIHPEVFRGTIARAGFTGEQVYPAASAVNARARRIPAGAIAE